MTALDSRGRSHSPAVRAQAERLGVDLGGIDGTGAGGRVTMANVLAAAPRPNTAPRPAPTDAITARQDADYLALFGDDGIRPAGPARPSAAYRKRPITVRSHFRNSVDVTIDAHGENPLVEDAAQTSLNYPLAILEAEPPTVFNSGNLPPFLASGLPPETVQGLPWQVRHFAAMTESRSEVLALVEKYAADPTVIDNDHVTSATADYENRVRQWLIGPGETS